MFWSTGFLRRLRKTPTYLKPIFERIKCKSKIRLAREHGACGIARPGAKGVKEDDCQAERPQAEEEQEKRAAPCNKRTFVHPYNRIYGGAWAGTH